MKENDELILQILDLEWQMFYATQNIGGKASCQNNRPTFEIMRRSQFGAWNEQTLSSYLEDLQKAEAAGDNLLAYKYAYMIEITSPSEYQNIKNLLPSISREKMELIERIIAINMEWYDEYARMYPKLSKKGRKRNAGDDFLSTPSVETYMMGELKTYSEKTLELLLEHFMHSKEVERNLFAHIVDLEMRQYGFKDIDEAERLA